MWLCCPNKDQLCPETWEILLGLLSVITHALCLTPTGATALVQSFEVGVWLAVFTLWHWARSSEIMKRTSGQIPNPPRLDAGINGLIKALLFVLVGRFTRNNQTTVYFSLPRVQTSTCVGCRVRVDLCVVWALLAHRPFWPQISRDSLCEPVASADSTTVIHWVVWLNTEGTSWEKSFFYTQGEMFWVN